MSTAMITACFTGLVRAIGMLLTVIVLAESINFFLFSGVSKETTANNVSNPYRFKNATKLTARAVGFIFFAHRADFRFALCAVKNSSFHLGNHLSSEKNYSSTYSKNNCSSTLQRNDETGKLFVSPAMQNLTTCL